MKRKLGQGGPSGAIVLCDPTGKAITYRKLSGGSDDNASCFLGAVEDLEEMELCRASVGASLALWKELTLDPGIRYFSNNLEHGKVVYVLAP